MSVYGEQEYAEGEDLSIHRLLPQEVMDVIRADIAAVTLPSWIERPPANFGSPSHGKVKADHWRTVCIVSLVITLVHLWGHSHAEEWEKKILNNFLHLVIAVEHVTKRSVNYDWVSIYERHMLQYLISIKEIDPQHDFVPNHHLSLHLGDCLCNFGPVHTWWCFPFERYNGIMSRMNTNNKASKSVV